MREDRCYLEPVDIVLRKHEKTLVAIYRNYSMRNPLMPQKKAKFGIEEWLALLKESKVISEDLTRREAILAFVWSRMRVPDALTNRFTVETLTQTDFYEAVCRIADFMSVTPIEDLEEIGVSSLTEFYEKIRESDDDEFQERALAGRPSAETLLAPKTQPLASKLELVLPYMFGHLACVFRDGIIPAGNGTPKIDLGQYLTPAQRKTYIKDGKSPTGMTRGLD